MASRKLIFAHNRVHWKCDVLGIDEHCTTETTWNSSLSLVNYSIPDLHKYITMIRGCSPRDLTYNSDALKAISGMLTVLSCIITPGNHDLRGGRPVRGLKKEDS